MIRVTVDVGAASAGLPGIRVEVQRPGAESRTFAHKRVRLLGEVVVTQGERTRDGAVAWVEAEDYAVIE